LPPQSAYDKWIKMSKRIREDVTREAQLKDCEVHKTSSTRNPTAQFRNLKRVIG